MNFLTKVWSKHCEEIDEASKGDPAVEYTVPIEITNWVTEAARRFAKWVLEGTEQMVRDQPNISSRGSIEAGKEKFHLAIICLLAKELRKVWGDKAAIAKQGFRALYDDEEIEKSFTVGTSAFVQKNFWGGTCRWVGDVPEMAGKTREEAHGVKR